MTQLSSYLDGETKASAATAIAMKASPVFIFLQHEEQRRREGVRRENDRAHTVEMWTKLEITTRKHKQAGGDNATRKPRQNVDAFSPNFTFMLCCNGGNTRVFFVGVVSINGHQAPHGYSHHQSRRRLCGTCLNARTENKPVGKVMFADQAEKNNHARASVFG